MSHTDRCRIGDPDQCMGCKVDRLGFDGGHVTRTTTDEAGNDTREHRSGRVDVRINARPVNVRVAVQQGER